jgi:hypothetical protein
MLLSCAAVLSAAIAVPAAQAASRGGPSCGVTHHDCYPACVQMTPDGSDCAKTRNVCRDICGPKPVYPSGVERGDVSRIEMVPAHEPRPMDEEPAVPNETLSPTEPSTP